MTAMCDVAFLLLSFFIMSATAKMPEPHPVDTPASTVIDKLPEEGVATITVGDSMVFFTIKGKEVRKRTLERMSAQYRIGFTPEEVEKFSNMEGFGVKMTEMKGLLALEPGERIKENVQGGIPYDSINNQLGDWVKFTRQANKEVLEERIANGEDIPFKDLDIAIKGDATEKYPTVKRVIEILRDQKKNRFFLVTGLRNENF